MRCNPGEGAYYRDPKSGQLVAREQKKDVVKRAATALKSTILGQTFMPEKIDLETPGQKTASVETFSTRAHSTITTERSFFGKLVKKNEGANQTQEFHPQLDKVFGTFSHWWMTHGSKILEHYPGNEGPGDHHPMYYQWKMARSLCDSTTGLLSYERVKTAFEDPTFYNKTMLFIEHEATMKAHALGLATEMPNRKLDNNILKPPKQARGATPVLERFVLGTLEADVSLAVLINTIYFSALASGIHLPAFQDALNRGALGAALLTVGLSGTIVIGRDAIQRVIRSFREQNEMNSLLRVCQESLQTIQNNTHHCDYMRDIYAVDPREFQVNAGNLEFVNGGSVSVGIDEMQEDLQKEEDLREQFLTYLVGLDRRALRGGNNDFKKVHGLTEEFITRAKNAGDLLVANQTGAVYQKEWLVKFDQLRRQAAVNLDPANMVQLQELYMEAGKQLLEKYADEMFVRVWEEDGKSAEQEVLEKTDFDFDEKNGTVQRRKQELRRASEGPPPVKEGIKRTKAKEEKRRIYDASVALLDGIPAKDGNAAVEGIRAAGEVVQSAGTSAETSLFGRKSKIEGIYSEVGNALRDQSFLLEARTVGETQDMKSIEDTLGKVRDKIDDITKTGGAQEQLKDKRSVREKAHNDRVKEIDTDAKSAYSSKDGVKRKREDLEREEELWVKEKTQLDAEQTKLGELFDALQTLAKLLNTKLEELRKQYDALQELNPERTKISSLPERMKNAYEKVGTKASTVIITDDKLVRYGETGHLFPDLLAAASARPWVAAEDGKHENGLTLLYGIAEAKARKRYREINGSSGDINTNDSIHMELLDPTKGGLTPEQLVAMSPAEVMRRMETKTAATVYSGKPIQDRLQAIREAQAKEIQRYQLRKQELDETIAIHERVNVGLHKGVSDVDKECDIRLQRLELVRGFIEDRGTHYREAPRMCKSERLATYADGAFINTSAALATDVARDGYLSVEKTSSYSRGFIEFMRDIFQYDKKRFLKGGAQNLDIQDINEEMLFSIIMESLVDSSSGSSVSPEDVVANMIVDSFPDFDTIHNGVADKHDLSFSDVMAIIQYRNNSVGAIPTHATARTVSLPVRPFEMKRVIENISVTMVKMATGSAKQFQMT